ncbi:hypothetical protein GOP47_0010230 [Adiantum capillus-veneris]|uniref:Glutathione S-transferase 3, mitochondrial n=1 Tax=Adiantum capillus-veneris TaxID=13818 RepID=A0A9D4UUC9_ADICA|nr:hypothetical protein GOP47_0010230 [Adiantum capillus-veneris]
MMFQVVKARKRYGVPFPTLYALESENKNAKYFNCVQRGHQNSLEFMPVFFVLVVLSGLEFPKVAASLGFLYCVGRFLYFKGYSTGEPDNRLNFGKYNFGALLGLLICSGVAGVRLLMQ